MTIPQDLDQPISALQRARNIFSKTQARIEETERTIQQTRVLIERTRSGNAAYASLTQAIDSIGIAEDPGA